MLEQLNLLSKSIEESEKNKVFFELTLKLLHKNNFEDFNQVLNYYENYTNSQLEEILKILIKHNKLEEIKIIFNKHNIVINEDFLHKLLNISSLEMTYVIFQYLPRNMITNDLLNFCNKKEVILFLKDTYDLKTEKKEELLLTKFSLMYKMENYICLVCKEENLNSLKYFKQYLELNSLNSNNFDPLIISIEKILKRDYNNKTTFLNVFSALLDENDKETLTIIKNFLSNIL